VSKKEPLESWNPGILELFFLLFLPLLFLFPAVVSADGISGVIELQYSVSDDRSEDSSGNVTETETKTSTQRYFLTLDKSLYPNLKFLANGTFEKIKSTFTTDAGDSETTVTTKRGLLSLSLDTRIISSSIGFNRREEKVRLPFGSTAPNLMDTYDASFSWRPVGLPLLNVAFTRTDNYDKDRELEDRLTDYLSLNLRYEPVRNLNLQGTASFNDTQDKLEDRETKLTTYQGRATYSRQFFRDRVSTNASYSFLRSETETTAKGTGEVLLQVFPFFGLSAINDMIDLVTLDSNPGLIDGNLTASSGINIGPVSPGGDDSQRQIGLDLINPSEVNTIYIWVDRELPLNVSNAFTWGVYISSDNENWTHWQTVPSAPFGSFFDRFEININSVSARYLKVVTNPLSPAVLPPPGIDVSSIIVTEMQAFLSASAEDVQGKQTQTSHVYDMNVRVLILDEPNLYYNFYGWGSYFDPGGNRYIISNSLNVTHRFSNIFTGSARIARDDSKEQDKRSANVYTASLTAVPLPTLYHRLILSGRFEETGEGSRNSHSVTLNNNAQLYEGVSLLLNGGASITTSETDRETVSTYITSGVSLSPHRRLNLNMNYTQTNSDQSGGGLKDTSSDRRTADFGVSYTPFDTLYLFASYARVAESGRDTIDTKNYSLSWSPFQGGDLQFVFGYSESIDSDDTKDRLLSSSLIWYLRGGSQLQASYQSSKSTSPALDSDSDIWFLSLRVAL
jgi:hypothetical protein